MNKNGPIRIVGYEIYLSKRISTQFFQLEFSNEEWLLFWLFSHETLKKMELITDLIISEGHFNLSMDER